MSSSNIQVEKQHRCLNSRKNLLVVWLLYTFVIVCCVTPTTGAENNVLANAGAESNNEMNAAEDGVNDGKLMEALDSNHDGILEQNEYDVGLSRIKSFLAKAANYKIQPLERQQLLLHQQQQQQLVEQANGFWKAFTSAVAMIIATEIGDKTFFIAAVLSMKHARSAVFLGAIFALIVMTFLSTAMGLILPQLIDRQYTHIMGGILFLYFGIKLSLESRKMESNQVSDELAEVEEELLQQKTKKQEELGGRLVHQDSTASSSVVSTASGTTNNGTDEEQGGAAGAGGSSTVKSPPSSANGHGRRIRRKHAKQQHWYSVAVQALSLTFLAEWGDRSQIATIALAAAKNPYGVTLGGCIGHMLCTGLAVMGGRMLAKSISEKTVTTFGGIVFFLFGIHSLFFES